MSDTPDLDFAAARLRLLLIDARAGCRLDIAALDDVAERLDRGRFLARRTAGTLEYIVEDACEDAQAAAELRLPQQRRLVLLQGGRV